MNIVQIGANRGNDDLTKIIFSNQEQLEKLILVEPLSCHYESLHKCYNGLPYEIIPVAITDNKSIKSLTFYYSIQDGPGYEVASVHKEHILKHGYKPEDIVGEEVGCMTINQLLEQHNIKKLDLLFIDAEGLDERIIRNIHFKKFDVKKIIYENSHIWHNDKLIEFLKTKNYSTEENWGKSGWSNVATKEGFRFDFAILRARYFVKTVQRQSWATTGNLVKSILRKIGLFEDFKKIKNGIAKRK